MPCITRLRKITGWYLTLFTTFWELTAMDVKNLLACMYLQVREPILVKFSDRLQNRGVQDILIDCMNNLNGFQQAINTVFPQTEVQSCIVHQIRNSLKHVASMDQKEVMRDLKAVYRAENLDLAELRLEELEKRWRNKYKKMLESWRNNWAKLSTFFRYDVRFELICSASLSLEAGGSTPMTQFILQTRNQI